MRFRLPLALAFCALISQPARAGIFSFLDSANPAFNGPHELSVRPDSDGLYYLLAEVNGAQVRFVIDTGSNIYLLEASVV